MPLGTFAVVCLMTGKVVLEHSDPKFFQKTLEGNYSNENPVVQSVHQYYEPIQVATAVTFTVALFQVSAIFFYKCRQVFLAIHGYLPK